MECKHCGHDIEKDETTQLIVNNEPCDVYYHIKYGHRSMDCLRTIMGKFCNCEKPEPKDEAK